MILGFRDVETRKIWEGKRSPRLPAGITARAERKLAMLDAARSLADLNSPPSNRLEPLKGDRHGQYSIRINQQWRICFVWTPQGADNVEIVDYH